MNEFDAIVIGSGQAGNPLVFKLASSGIRTALIEKEHFGGTCLNNGCTPTKAYIASARRMWDARHGNELGIVIPEGAYADLKQIKRRKDFLVQQSADKIRNGIKKTKNILFYKGEAKFTGNKIISVNGEELTAPEIYIDVGARPLIPESFKNINYLTNESILRLEKVPEHLIIVGGSYNGLEFGQMFSRFGSRVTIVEKENRLVSHEDKEISENILQFLKDEKIEIRLDANCISGRQNSNGTVTVQLECAEGEPVITGTHLLLAVGRTPNTDTMNLKSSGVGTNEKGYIKVNDYLETNAKGIYALGDCNGNGAFTHTAYHDYEIISGNKFDGKNKKVSDRILTYALYTDPPLGRAGITRQTALDKGL